MKTERQVSAPLFTLFTIDELERSLAPYYGIRYLADIRDGKQPVRPLFRKRVSELLGRPESELFYEEGAGQ